VIFGPLSGELWGARILPLDRFKGRLQRALASLINYIFIPDSLPDSIYPKSASVRDLYFVYRKLWRYKKKSGFFCGGVSVCRKHRSHPTKKRKKKTAAKHIDPTTDEV
jgi:hypothetical protein